MRKWMRAVFCIFAASYAGGLLASYAILAIVPGGLQPPDLRVYPFYFALGIMIFTVPGAGLVAALHNLNREQGIVAYVTAIATGTVVGSLVLWPFLPATLATFCIGALYGFATAACWSLLHAALGKHLPTARAD